MMRKMVLAGCLMLLFSSYAWCQEAADLPAEGPEMQAEGSELQMESPEMQAELPEMQAEGPEEQAGMSDEVSDEISFVTEYTGAYNDVIELYRNIYETGRSQDREYIWQNNISEMIAYSEGVGCALADLDGNGVPELLIEGLGTEDFSQKMLYALYTLVDGKPVNVLISQARDRYYLREDGTLLNEASGGASHSYIMVKKLNESKLETVEMIFTDDITDENGSFGVGYYYQEGTFEFGDPLPGENSVTLTAEEFGNRMQEMEKSITTPELNVIYTAGK